MLIRWATQEDKPAWMKLADNISNIFGSPTMSTDKDFQEYMDNKLSRFEALISIDRRSGNCLGIISFSREHNRISWFGVFEQYRSKGIGTRLLSTALRQLDTSKEITVITFRNTDPAGLPARAVYHKAGFKDEEDIYFDHLGNPRCKMVLASIYEKRGGSFHYNYPGYDKYSKKEFCLCCNNVPAPDFLVDIAELEYSFATAERIAQGRLFGKCHVLIKKHYVDFEEISQEDMAGFMSDVQKVGKALHKVTRAIKINYEIHSNSGPHIHCHLFPRYLDDDFPSAPIDYRITAPSPYESEEEFEWFLNSMRNELKLKRTIVVVPYDKKWADEFEKIKADVMPAIYNDIISIEHVGSTSVPGLWAKPIIDLNILVENTRLKAVIEKLSGIGYIHEGDLGIEGREAFRYSDKPHLMLHYLYVCTKDSAEYKRQIAFRDYLRSHPEDCKNYSEIKIEMAKKFPHDIDSYIKGKEPVVMEIYKKCGILPWKQLGI